MSSSLPVAAPAERNKGPILDVLRGALPARGRVLELASGTGQHVVHFAQALPGIEWHPSEPDAERRAVVAERVRQSRLTNVREPLALDVLAEPWPPAGPFDAVLAINLIHIAPWTVTAALIRGAARMVAGPAHGLLVLYGPYKEEGRHSAASNEAFDERLRAEDPAWGVRNLEDVSALASAAGFGAPAITRMPANNLTLVFRCRGASTR